MASRIEGGVGTLLEGPLLAAPGHTMPIIEGPVLAELGRSGQLSRLQIRKSHRLSRQAGTAQSGHVSLREIVPQPVSRLL